MIKFNYIIKLRIYTDYYKINKINTDYYKENKNKY